MPRNEFRRWGALSAVLIAALTACSGDDDSQVTATLATTAAVTTAPPPTPTPTTTAAPPTTASPTTTTEPPTTTTAAPPTTTIDDLKAQIVNDYVTAAQRARDYASNPTADALEATIALVAAPDSAYAETMRDVWSEFVAVGDAMILNDPPVYEVTVEHVELDPGTPVAGAVLTVCTVDNAKRVTLPEHSPNGEEFYVSGGDLAARRSQLHVALTPQGWLRDALSSPVTAYPGVTKCPPA